MPRLPTLDDLDRVRAQPSGAIVSGRTGDVARAAQSAGAEIEALASQEVERLDTLKITEAETALMRAELELEQEYKQVKNGGVLQPDFHRTFQDRYKSAAERASGLLSTPAQKAKFGQVVGRRGVGFDAGRVSYAMGEAEQYKKVVFESRAEAIIDKGATVYKDPTELSRASLELEDFYSRAMVEEGITDVVVLETGLKDLRQKFWGRAIEQAINNNDVSTATTLFAGARGMLTQEQQRAYGNTLDSANATQLGTTIAREAYDMLQAGANPAKVELYVMERAGSSKEAYSAAQAGLTNIREAETRARAEQKGTLLEQFSKQGANARARASIMASPEFHRLSPIVRGELSEYMREQAEQATDRAYTLQQRARAAEEDRIKAKYRSPEVLAAFYREITNPALKDKSRQEIWSMTPDIGPDLVSKLLTEHDKQLSGQKPITLDKTIIEAAKPPSLKKDKKAAQNDAFEGYIREATAEWEAQNPGKKPGVEEQKAIARSALTEYNISGRYYGTTTLKAYENPEGVTKDARMPEAEWKRAYIRHVAAVDPGRKTPVTPEEIDAKYVEYLIDLEKGTVK